VPSEETSPHGGVPAGLEFFYAAPGAVAGGTITVEGEEFEHLTQVMRHIEGDTIGIVDGAGMAYVTTVATLRKRSAQCSILSTHPRLHEPARQVTLALAVLKNPSRFDLVVEKATELGVCRIIPMVTARTIARHARVERWQAIALAAMKQCGRCVLPAIPPVMTFEEVIAGCQGGKVLFHEQASTLFGRSADTHGTLAWTVCIGPEGGFTGAEVASALAQQWSIVSVSDRRLRSETAAILAAALLLTP